ncbi:MAG TPA: peptidoglycan-binding domain-containing protein, partial [Chthoniobacterales bacterium]|nr:peptidoglycan-binding domain-containing protein [Chthoniobacterales bacterium]
NARQQRSFRPEGVARSSRMMNPDMNQAIRSRVHNQPRFDSGSGTPARVENTASAEQSVQAPIASRPRVATRDADRVARIRELVNRNRERRNRRGDVQVLPGATVDSQTGAVTAPGAGVENQTGAATAPGADQRESHRRNRSDRHRKFHERHEGDPDFDRKHRRWHDREWYRRNYNRFVLFGGGYYYWNRGYWFPAYGYHPSYSSYVYNAPIYSYNGLPPGQVLAIVQTQLQQRGYYNAAVDGTYGPVTRQALLNYQADNGLPMTGEVDQRTLLSLGLD